MALPEVARATSLPQRLRARLAQPQHRTATYLTLNNVMGAATGVLFWLLLARVAGLGPAAIGIGYTVVALGTVVGVVAKGGFDTALLVKVPGSGHLEGRRLLSFGLAIAAAVSLALTALLGAASLGLGLMADLDAFAWLLVAAIAVLLVMTWLQDAYFVSLGQARRSFERNFVLTAGRILLPLPIVLLAVAHPVPLTWGLALAASAAVGAIRVRSVPYREGRLVPRREFVRSAARNVTGSASEFLPGLLLAPLVFAVEGPEAAAYFGMAWTAASLVFQVCSAIGRGTLAQIVQAGPDGTASAIRQAAVQTAWVAAPLALAVAVFASPLLGVFGPAYATEGALALAVLCASTLVVAPAALYLAVLRARDRSRLLVVFPLAMIATLAVVAPLLGARFGLVGVAYAWFAANLPFGLYAAWRLRQQATRRPVPPPSASQEIPA